MFKNCIKTKEIWSDLATALLTGSQYDQLKFFKAEHTGGTVSSNHFHLPHCRWISNKQLTGAAGNRTFTDGWMFGSVLCFWGKTVSIKTWRWACVRAHASAVGRVNRVWDCSNTPQGTNRNWNLFLKSFPHFDTNERKNLDKQEPFFTCALQKHHQQVESSFKNRLVLTYTCWYLGPGNCPSFHSVFLHAAFMGFCKSSLEVFMRRKEPVTVYNSTI